MFYSNGAYSLFKVDTPVISGGATPPSFQDIYSYEFDGVDDYVEIGSPTSIQNLTSAITISAWIKAPKTFSTQQYTLASKGEYAASGSQWTIQIYTANASNTNGGYFQVFPQANAITDRQTLTFPTAIDDNQWHHIMCVNDGTDLKVYIDGVLDATGVGKGRTLYNGNRTLRLGRLTASTVNKLIGNLDEVAIFGTALALSDAQTIYNSGVPNDLSSFNPVSWWRMGESASWDGSNWTLTDQGSGGNDATSQNMAEASRVTDVPPNPFVNTLSTLLDGVDDFVRIGTTSLGITTAISVSAWVKTTNSASNQYIIAEDPRSTNNRNWLLQFRANGEIQCVIWSSNGSSLTSAITPLTYNNGQWHNVIATFDGTTNANGLKVYVNGTNVVQATASVSGIFSSSSSEPIIGADSITPTLPFSGNIDEVAVWNTELSASDITTIYNSAVPNDISSLSPLSWWRCGDGDTSPTLTDNGSGGNDGTMTNFSTFSTDVPT